MVAPLRGCLPDADGGSGAWRTLLVGGLGAGGRGVYALDVTDPADFLTSESTAADRVLWDIVGGDTGFTNLGYTYSKPEIVRMPDDTYGGVWTAVFGNGYKSPDGRAVALCGERRDRGSGSTRSSSTMARTTGCPASPRWTINGTDGSTTSMQVT